MASLGQLVVSLTAETAQFRQSMDRAAYQSQKNFQQITSAAKMAGAAIGLALSGASFVRAIKSQIDLADELAKTSQKIGVQVEDLQKLRYAADLSGVSNEVLTRALGRLSTEAVKGSDALKKIGVSLKDSNGNTKTSAELLKETAGQISKYSDGVQKSALVTEIFGDKLARELIPLLNLGKKGIEDLANEAEQLGFILSADAAASAEEFNDNLTRLGRVTDGLIAKITIELLPGLVAFTDQLIDIAKNTQVFETVGKAALVVFQTFAVVGANVAFVFNGIATEISGIARQLAALASGDFKGFSAIREQMVKDSKEAREALDRFEASIMGLGKTIKKSVKDSDGESFSDEIAKGIQDTEKSIQRLQKEYQALFLTRTELAVLDAENLGATKQQIETIRTLSSAILEQTEIQKEQKKAQEEALQKQKDLEAQASRIYSETRSPIEALNIRLAELNDLLDKGAINWDTWARASEAAQDAYDNAVDTAKQTQTATIFVRDLGNAIGTAFEDAVMSGKGFMDILKGLEQDIIRIIFRLYIMKSIEATIGNTSGPIGGFLDSLFGGGRAIGGPVSSGTAYLVGERGPELFVPPSGGGSIVPNEQLGSSGISVVNNFVISTPTDRRTQQQIGAMAGMGVQRAISRNT
jgi:hypothetical protein